MSAVLKLARPEILALQPYQHAAWEPELERLHANELPWRSPGDDSLAGLNRYPEPQPRELIARLAALYDVPRESLLAGRGSDEAIDLLVRAFCRAGQDAVLICPPTFGMYSVAARIQGAAVVEVPLRAAAGFALDEAAVLAACTPRVRIVFLCSPNNPTGNLMDPAAVLRLAAALAERSLVVLDEAYIEFAGVPSAAAEIVRHPNLVALRTLSKAHALAGARCGTLIADAEIVALLRRIIPPYAIPELTNEAVCAALTPPRLAVMRARVETIVRERERLARALAASPQVARVWPSAANFLLVEFHDAADALARARAERLLLRDFRRLPGLGRSLRISVGTPEQNERLLRVLGGIAP